MKKFIRDIREQSHTMRVMMFGLCTFSVIVLVVGFWFKSFEHNVFTALNPDKALPEEQRNLASTQSLFGSIGDMFKNTKAQIGSLFGAEPSVSNNTANGQIHLLPLSEEK